MKLSVRSVECAMSWNNFNEEKARKFYAGELECVQEEQPLRLPVISYIKHWKGEGTELFFDDGKYQWLPDCILRCKLN